METSINIDVDYLAKKICDMSGVPIRIYEADELVAFHSIIPLLRDPFTLHQEPIMQSELSVGYYLTNDFDYYCFLRFHSDRLLVIGPSRHTDYTDHQIKQLSAALNVSSAEYEEFKAGISALIHMPLDSLLQVLSSLQYVLNFEKIELEDIKILDSNLDLITDEFHSDYVQAKLYPTDEVAYSDIYKSYQVEQLLCEYIRHGDVDGFLEWSKSAPSLRTTNLSKDYLRHLKNTLIVSGTLFSRAAIRGGMDLEEAINLCDDYILKCEQANSSHEIMELQYHMARSFAEQVQKIRFERIDSEIKRKVYFYIQKHMSDTIRTADIAESLYMSRSYLSTYFKQTTGINLNDYIHLVKMSEAKHLLSYSDKSIAMISNYLGYSSQSYFCNIFKKYTGLTPKEFEPQGRR